MIISDHGAEACRQLTPFGRMENSPRTSSPARQMMPLIHIQRPDARRGGLTGSLGSSTSSLSSLSSSNPSAASVSPSPSPIASPSIHDRALSPLVSSSHRHDHSQSHAAELLVRLDSPTFSSPPSFSSFVNSLFLYELVSLV